MNEMLLHSQSSRLTLETKFYLGIVDLSQNSQGVERGLAYSASPIRDHRRHSAGHGFQLELGAGERHQGEDQQLQRVLSRLCKRNEFF